MYRRILVPLDGSKLAEAALPLAIRIAKCFDSEVILFHGLEQNPPETIHGEPLYVAGRMQSTISRLCKSLYPEKWREAR
jgi:nucleotide-binding universal stress UspA family protein